MAFYDKVDFTLRYVNSFIDELGRALGRKSDLFKVLFKIRESLKDLKEEILSREGRSQKLKLGGKELVTKKWVSTLETRIAIMQLLHQQNEKQKIPVYHQILENGKTFGEQIEMILDVLVLFFNAF